uniref:Fe2OG dioxygenase domain-containing protein n=1 Tax=viral metagenome TaxID=1070528 RepID=A0A6C0JTV9_9ZZZZ
MDFIYEIDNFLSSEQCKDIIKRFELDHRKFNGTTVGGYDEKTKRSTDLFISELPDWSDIDKIVCGKLTRSLNQYIKYVEGCMKSKNINFHTSGIFFNLSDTGYKVQRLRKGEYYNWHEDFSRFSFNRMMTCIIYLTTLDDEDGGKTEFECGKSVQPVEGKLVMFPATWTNYHRGQTVLGKTKYILTTFITRTDEILKNNSSS